MLERNILTPSLGYIILKRYGDNTNETDADSGKSLSSAVIFIPRDGINIMPIRLRIYIY